MTNAITDPSSGTVVLRGIVVELNSDVGMTFAIDCTRFVEGLVTEEQLKAKYQLDVDAWRALAENEPLQRLVGRQKELRIRSGETAREKAAHLFVTAPDVLSDIIRDPAASPRHKVESIRELRQIAAVGSDANTPATERERFVISINFGKGHSIQKTLELKPIEPKRDKAELKDDDCEYGERDF
jgi:hypothetical protein